MPFAVFTFGGSDYEIKNYTLTTSFQKIQFAGKNIKGFLMKTKEFNAELELVRNDGDANILTIPPGTPFPGNFQTGDGILGWVRVTKGSANLQVLATF